MRRILRAILLLAVLCLTGCSSEDPQSVAFSVKEIEVGPDATRMSITIEANCPWTVTDEKDKTFTEIKQGSGTVETPFIVFTNPDYETKQYTVTVTSEDGTSTDVLTVTQGEAFGLEADKASPVAAEGGSIDIPVRTNDQIDNIETPEWIAFTSSRSLTGYTYTFTAEPNKTGSPRTGYIVLEGKNYTSSRIEVKQDSYAPTGVVVEDMPENTTDSEIDVKISLEPSYADWGKIKAEASDDATAVLTEGLLKLSMNTYGIHTFSIRHKTSDMTEIDGNGSLFSSAIERFPEKIFRGSATRNLYIGENISLYKHYDSDEYVMLSSNENVAKIQEDGSILATGKGSASINITHPDLDVKDSVEVNVNRVRFAAWMDTYLNWGASWTIYIYATIEGANITKAAFATGDYKQAVVFPQGVKKKEFDKGVNYVTYDCTISVMVNSVEELKERLNHIKVEFSGVVDGEEVMETVTVLPEKP